MALMCLGSAVERPCMVGTEWAISLLGLENGLLALWYRFLALKFFFSVCMGGHWLRAVTESSVVRACGSVTNLHRIAARKHV